MYNHVRGRLVEKNPAFVVVEASGIGYQINISLNTYSKLGADENIFLFTHLVVREDAWQLFGFADAHERTTFQHLIAVSGVGPNTARVILSSLTADEVEHAILSENTPLLQGVKGIGAKTAQRIIVDLKDKIGKNLNSGTSMSLGANTSAQKAEAVSALEILGFNRVQVQKVVNGLTAANADMSVEEIVKQALKKL